MPEKISDEKENKRENVQCERETVSGWFWGILDTVFQRTNGLDISLLSFEPGHIMSFGP